MDLLHLSNAINFFDFKLLEFVSTKLGEKKHGSRHAIRPFFFMAFTGEKAATKFACEKTTATFVGEKTAT